MSFLNPTAWSPRLGVNIAPLLKASSQQQGPGEPDAAWFVNAAASAGADSIVLALSAPALEHQQSNVNAVLGAMVASQLDVPLSDAMVDYVCAVRPSAVCFRIDPTTQRGVAGSANADDWLRLMQNAVTRLNARSIRVIMSFGPEPAQVSQLHEAGVTAIELNTAHFAQASQKSDALQLLQNAIISAKRLGMTVHLGHGIQYHHIEQLATLGDIDQINVGHAIMARALMVGWTAAVSEMKALLVASYAPIPLHAKSRHRSTTGAAS